MPSTTTTTVTIGTILDLIGPPTQSTAANDGQSGFDSLLQDTQTPPSPPPPPPSPSPVDTHPSAVANSRSPDRGQQPSENRQAANDPSASGSNQQHEPSQPALTPTRPPAAAGTNKPEEHEKPEHPTDNADEQLASEQIIAQSLAGLPTAPKNVPPPALVAPTDNAANPKDEPGEPGKRIAARPANSISPGKAANQPKTSAADTHTDADPTASDDGHPSPGHPLQAVTPPAAAESTGHEKAAKPHAMDKVEAIQKSETDQEPTDESQQTSDIKLAVDEKTQPAETAKHEQSRTGDPSQVNGGTSALAAAPVDGANSPQPSTATPVVAATTNTSPAANPSEPTRSANSNTTTAITSGPPRPRLPAQVLAPAAGTVNRRAPVEVDAARLINRVVRAFSAAQDRDGDIRLRLSPPELGSLQLNVRVENGALTAHLQTETDSARAAIIDNLPALRERLAEQGVRIERFDVDLMQRQSGGMPDQPGGHQPDTPEAPLRFAQRPSSAAVQPAAVSTTAASSLGNTGGLNVIV